MLDVLPLNLILKLTLCSTSDVGDKFLKFDTCWVVVAGFCFKFALIHVELFSKLTLDRFWLFFPTC